MEAAAVRERSGPPRRVRREASEGRGSRRPWPARLRCALLVCALGCADASTEAAPPNVLWVVWDTVRAANLSLYGHERPTTPHLEAWARDARVFDDVVSAASTTLPSHASMFTGQLPVQHGVSDGQPRLAEAHDTLAERLRDAGYRTYLFSANPYVGAATGLAQGFERIEHPWSPAFEADAARIVAAKTRRYAHPEGSELPEWATHVRTAGALAGEGLLRWLAEPPAAPFFAVLNYMEAHQPLVPDLRFRQALMTPEQVERSYREPVIGAEIWTFTAGLSELDEERLEVLRLTYDAAIAELDHLFAELLAALERRGLLEDTLVVLTSDHGELLGEHHRLDHQYSVHEPLLRVPLLLHHPRRIPAGREPRPVATLDLFPTLLRLAGVSAADGFSQGVDLLEPDAARRRLSEYPFASRGHLGLLAAVRPDFDLTPHLRSLRAYRSGSLKYVQASDGSHELYDLAADPGETRNLLPEAPERAAALHRELEGYVSGLARPELAPQGVEFGDEMRRRLEALGYGAAASGRE